MQRATRQGAGLSLVALTLFSTAGICFYGGIRPTHPHGEACKRGAKVGMRQHINDREFALPANAPIAVPVEASQALLNSTSAKASAATTRTWKRRTQRDAYDELPRDFNRERLLDFFSSRPLEVVRRGVEIARELGAVKKLWDEEEELSPAERTRGAVLRDTLARLGPVFVKIGQTLAQRPDLIGDDACEELKTLQQRNEPFSNKEAFTIILEDLDHAGPLVPGGFTLPGHDPNAPPLFAELTAEPIAAASLGQVYRGLTLDGREIAVKVQRPGVSRQVALDWTCWALGLALLSTYWGGTLELSVIADEVATGVFLELDYHHEAANAAKFLEKHDFLPFITAPSWLPEYSGEKGKTRVLTLEWIHGRSLEQLEDPAERRMMVDLAVEACVSALVFTGFVHADPHEGNLLLTDDGRLAFLDFGLMGNVEPRIMEGFAAGIQHMLAGRWLELARVFQEVEFIPKPEDGGFQRVVNPDERIFRYVPASDDEFAAALEEQMSAEEGGLTRFGAIASALTKLSRRYHMSTPPYVILFARTFITLEGIAAKARPDFNIYAASLPYAVRRGLAPETESAIEALRGNLLTPVNAVRWEFFTALAKAAGLGADSNATAGASDQGEADYGAALTQVLASRQGSALRRILADIDLLPTLSDLSTKDGRFIRAQCSDALADKCRSSPLALLRRLRRTGPLSVRQGTEALAALPAAEERAAAVETERRIKLERNMQAVRQIQRRRFWERPVPEKARTVFLGSLVAAQILAGVSLRLLGVRALARKMSRR
mmetsp:Transcript_24472/g.56362  ORF Transcript_24472/g.56362 Transcript_24472/m.56362 type:complete len:776 (+) Transcript_24472:59-2386(+)